MPPSLLVQPLWQTSKDDLIAMAKAAATRHGLFPSVLCGLIDKESTWNPWAYNPEPSYRWLWDFKLAQPRPTTNEEAKLKVPPQNFTCPAHIDPDAEWWGQQASFGLTQMMGAASREHGFNGPFLLQTCDPALNLELGCLHLLSKLRSAQGNLEKALLLWNGGGNPHYPEEVLLKAQQYA